MGFANLACIVSEQWKTVDPNLKQQLEAEACLDKIRYHREMKVWNLAQKMNKVLKVMKTQA